MAEKFKALKQKMMDAGLVAGKPGWQIVVAAGLKPPSGDDLYGDSDPIALVKLMKAFNAYGRKKWKWVTNAEVKKNDLMLGTNAASYCRGFNLNFRWLAMEVFGLSDFSLATYKGAFITRPSDECIDRKWPGNVRTQSADFSALNCYKFTDHYWAKWKGTNLDVCFNRVFSGPETVVLSKLEDADSELATDKGYGSFQLFKLANPQREGDHLAMIKEHGRNGWPEWLIVPEDDIPHKK